MNFTDLTAFDFKSESMRQIIDILPKASRSIANTLICGPAGSGKSNLIRNITQKLNPGWREPIYFDALNRDSEFINFIQSASALPRVICVENVDNLSICEQRTLIQVIQSLKGSNNFRFIATSRFDLINVGFESKFLSDLYYKLAVIKIDMPGLNDRRLDIEELVGFMCEVNNIIYNRNLSLAPSAVEKLQSWKWTENVRELENVIERAFVNCKGLIIEADDIEFFSKGNRELGVFLGMSLSQMEEQLIKQTLDLTNQNRTKAADILGISIRTLRNKLNEYRQEGFCESI